jgi:hypothetical protein
MNAIRAIFKPSTDGKIHLPIPPELMGNERLRVVAWLEPDVDVPRKTGAGEWARKSVGIARPYPGESRDDARHAALAKKFGTT